MFNYLKKYWIYAILAPLFMILEVAMDLTQPRLMKIIVDEGVLGLSNNGTGNTDLIISTGLKMIFFVAIGVLGGIMCGVFANIAAQNFGNDLRKDTFRQIMSFSFEQTDEFSTGSLITRVTNDITQVQQFVMMALRGFFRTFTLIIGGIICMVSLNLKFGLVILCSLPFIIICVIFFISKTNPIFSVLQKKLDKVNNVLQENVSGSRVIKAYVQEDYETRRFCNANNELVNTQLKVLLIFSYMTPIMNILLNISVVAVIKIGSIEVINGSITPGVIIAAITYVTQVLNAVMRMTMMFQTASRGYASGKRISEVLHTKPSIIDGDFDSDTEIKGKIEFKNVSFSYPGMKDNLVLDNISLVINPGETIGILGSTGCGKTSFVNLIPRFFDVNSGEVLLDDVNVKNYRLSKLRDKIALASQKSEAFSKSLKENIQWGNTAAGFDDIKNAAKIAQALDFIENAPDGFDSIVNQGGTSLSGGQLQRLSISRAVLKDAEVIIFDDATSALDLKTEANLYKMLNSEKKNCTKIIVAQRIASVKDADRIIVMDNGKITDIGSHKELIKTSEIYKDIYSSQLGGVKDE